MTPDDLVKQIEKCAKQIETYANTRFPAEAGDTALRFINGNFRAQGWQGTTFVPWKKNKSGGTTLVKTGHLRSAFYYISGPGEAILRNLLPYANIHNEGGELHIPITKKMRKYFWAMYYKEAGKGIKTRTTKKGITSTFQSIDIGKKANKWRAMALTKKEAFDFKIEQRQFAPTDRSPSPVLENAVARKIEKALERILNDN